MKRCPECRKDYLDDSLLYCLDDGTPLVQGSVSDEPATAILSEPGVMPLGGSSSEDATRNLKTNDTADQKRGNTSRLSSLLSRKVRPWIIAGCLALTLIAFGAWRLLIPPVVPPPFVTLDVAAPPGWVTTTTSALSPDGSRLAFTAHDSTEKSRLWVRVLGSGESQMLADTEEALEPFWSPDGAEIGFFTRDRLRAVSVATGRSRVICDVIGARRAGTWNSSGVIIFATESGVPIKKVSADGKAEPVALPHGGFRPFFLPDGRHFLFGDTGNNTGLSIGVYLGDLETGEVKTLRPDGAEPKYAGGFLFFVLDGELRAQSFDPKSLKLSGDPIPIANIGRHSGVIGTNFSVAPNGLIAFRREAEVAKEIAWYGRDGKRNVAGEPGSWTNPAFSPDDSLVALENGAGSETDIWLFDTARGTSRMFASGRPFGATSPIWSADGRTVLYARRQTGIFAKQLDGGSEHLVVAGANANAVGISSLYLTQIISDGTMIGFRLNNGNRDIVVRKQSGDESFFAQSNANETQPAVSPNEHWLAYVYYQEESPDTKVIYIEAFPGGGQKLRVSGDLAGVQPRWRRDGRELYYLALDGQLMAVSVEEVGGGLRLGAPKALFKTLLHPGSGLGTRANYDAMRDGSRFIVTEPRADGGENQAVTVLVNWMSALPKN